jgi:hypothetical protein
VYARLLITNSVNDAVTRTWFCDEVQFEQANSPTEYITPTQGTPWGADFYRTGGTGGVASGAVALTPSAYNGNTKVLTHEAVLTPNKNLVQSKSTSDFSNGTVSGWWTSYTTAGSTVTYDTTNGVGDTGCCKVVSTGTMQGCGLYGNWYPVTPGLVYSLSMSMKGASGSESIRLYIDWYNVNRSNIGSDEAAVVLTASHARYSCNGITAPAGAAYATFRVVQNAAGSYTYYLDEVQFEQSASATSYEAPAAGASDGTTYYVVGPGIYIWGAQLEVGSEATSYAQTQTKLQRGSNITSSDSADPIVIGKGLRFIDDDYLISGHLSDIDLGKPLTLIMALRYCQVCRFTKTSFHRIQLSLTS